eukprot:1587142-Pyramimonas_sp.AAC.1
MPSKSAAGRKLMAKLRASNLHVAASEPEEAVDDKKPKRGSMGPVKERTVSERANVRRESFLAR